MKARIFTILLIIIWAAPMQGQLTVSDTLPKFDLLETLFGGGVDIFNLQVQCDTTLAMWEFDGVNSNLGLDRGVLISSGECQDVPMAAGVACNSNASTDLNQPGYPPLNALLPGFNSQDACVIQFDMVPYCDSVGIRYVFASEEYPEWVNSTFNDVFAFFITAPGATPTVADNIALIPGTATPVSINNVNNGTSANCTVPGGPCSNCAYYVDNGQGTTLAYDAFTVPMTAIAEVVPCDTYTVTLAIADMGDGILDSGVFLEADGISCFSTILLLEATNNTTLGNNVAVEGCVDGEFTIDLPAPLGDTAVFHIQIGGTATPGADYIAFPDSVVFLPGQTTVSVPVILINDGLLEGVETVIITYTDTALCALSIYTDSAVLEIFDPPDLFQPVDGFLCSGDTIPIGVPPVGGQTYLWDPPTGLSSPIVGNPNLTLTNANNSPAVYEYVLTTTALQGFCEFRDTITITVHPANQAEFEADTVCHGVATSFTDLTFADSIISWDWDFGDTQVGSDQNPNHIYDDPGIYEVELITINASGCPDTFATFVLIDSLPIVDYTADPVCDGAAMQYSHLIGPGINYDWTFGDNNGTNGILPSHTYGGPGFYTSQLVATTAEGCVDSSSVQVQVYENPSPDFTAVDRCFGFDIDFTNLTNLGTGGSPVYAWDFGDLSPINNQFSPSHLYGNHGIQNVSLTVTDEFGCTNTIMHTVEVFPPVDAQFNYTAICFGDTTPFQDLSQFEPNGPIQDWYWSFGDGSSSDQQNPIHFYESHGSYTVIFGVNTIHGCTDTIELAIDVYDQPIADFSFENDCDEQPISFTNLSQFNNSNVSYNWDFNDNNIFSNQMGPTHTFSGYGNYDVTMTITNANGCNDTRTHAVEIYPLPITQFDAGPNCAWTQLDIENTSYVPAGGTIASYFWAFDNGQTSEVRDPDFTFYEQGNYQVFHKIVSNHGCPDSLEKTVAIYPRPEADFRTDNPCVGEEGIFENLSSVSDSLFGDYIADWTWEWGDGTSTGAIPEPRHVYSGPGIYPVTLTVVTDKGCIRRRTYEIEAYPLPEAPEVEDDVVCFADPAFLLAVTRPPTERVDWYTEVSGGSPIFSGNAYITPPVLFPVTYYIEPVTDQGCTNGRYPISSVILDENQGNLMASDTVVSIPNAIVNFGVAGTFEVASYEWNFGDGQKSEAEAPAHQYQYPGIFTVSVKLVDDNGCEITLERVIEVKQLVTLFVPTGFSPNDDGENDEFFIGHNLLNQFSIDIFNRWGESVYHSDNPDFRWNGRDTKGSIVPEGVYIFKVLAQDIQGNAVERNGTLTVIK